jgi:hypothetical protein
MTYVILSARDRYGRNNNTAIAGPSEYFVREALGVDEPVKFVEDITFWPPPGSRVLVTGQRAAAAWFADADFDLNARRGFLTTARACAVMPTFNPIDCVDITDHEPESFDNFEDDNADDKNHSKDSAPTARRNYRFWFLADAAKLARGVRCGSAPRVESASGSVIEWLNVLDNQRIFVDIETHPPTNTLQCLALATDTGPIFSVPCYDHRGQPRLHLPRFAAALARAMRRNTVVGHNVSFDLGFLAHYHGIPWGPRIEDTMIQHHRCFPESEKSLAHVISYWINAPYHKDAAGTFTPYNEQQYQKLLAYNAADVATTRAVYLAQRAYIEARPGLAASVRAANASIEVYLRAGLCGFEFSELERAAERKNLELKGQQLSRILHTLVGYSLLPTSPQQLADYFYTRLKYPVTDRTDAGAPSTAADTLYKLLLKHPRNVALKVLLALRDVNKQADMLKFKPYYHTERR